MKKAAGFRISPTERLLALFFPARCLECGCVVTVDELFCRECERRVLREPCLKLLTRPDAGIDGLMTAAPMKNEGGFRDTILRYKFQGYRGLSKPLGRLMARAAPALDKEFDCVTYVPLSEKSRKSRGYNQALLLAGSVAEQLELPLIHALKKVRETEAQHELSRPKRFKNVKGAYEAVRELNGERVLLIDDIITTGATILECAATLYKAGAGKVCGLCAALTDFDD